ncbi:MAG: PilN domain-containing protein [Ferruginibacter sp.]|nr:PilN domain-containing protein [Rhodoferax sp.]
MPQQVNLCSPILLAPKRYFSAATMLQGLAIFAVVGGSLCAYGVWSLNEASESFKPTLARQSSEIKSMQSALARSKTGGASLEAVLAQELLAQSTELAKREKLLEELHRGLFQPGAGYAARLQLVAQSIPSQVWVTEVKANERQLEVKGFTLLPSALNDWAIRLAASPLLTGQKLATIKVENTIASPLKNGDTSVGPAVGAASLSITDTVRPAWFFSMVSAVGPSSATIGAKP